MSHHFPVSPGKLLVSLLAGSLNDNVSIMRHEGTIEVLAAAAAPMFAAGLEAVYRAGEASGGSVESGAAQSLIVFATSLSSALEEQLKKDLVVSDRGPWLTHEEVMGSLRESGRALAAERAAAGEDASMLRGLAQEYDYRVAEAVDEGMAEGARDLATRLRALASRLDLRAMK